MARSLVGASRKTALFAGFLYMAGPVVLTKVTAGHFSYLQSYAALPYFITAIILADSRPSLRWFTRAAIAAAFTTVQIQFIGFDVLIVAFMLVARLMSIRTAAIVGILAAAAVAPTFIGPILIANASTGALDSQHAVLTWQLTQSVQRLPALEGRGYFTSYYEHLTPPLFYHFLILFPLIALLALANRKMRKLRWFLFCVCLSGWLITTSLQGPLVTMWRWLFLNVVPASLYRESYDAMVLTWLPYVLCAAAFLCWIRRPWALVIALMLALPVIPAWYSLPKLFGSISAEQIPIPTGSTLSPGYVIWLPAAQPMGPLGTLYGGADPLAFEGFGRLLPLFEYQPSGEFARALFEASHQRWNDAASIFAQLSISRAIYRSDIGTLVSGTNQPVPLTAPSSKNMVFTARRGEYTIYRVRKALPLLHLQRSAGAKMPTGFHLARSYLHSTPNAADLVAAFPFFWQYAAIGACGSGALIGTAAVVLRTNHPWFLMTQARDGQMCEWTPRDALLKLPKAELVIVAGWAHAPRRSKRPDWRSAGTIRAAESSPDHLSGTLDARQDADLVLNTRYDDRWRLQLDEKQAAPFASSLDMLAWHVPRGKHTYRIWFTPAHWIHLLLIGSMMWLAFLAVLAACSPDCNRNLRTLPNGL